MAAAIGKMLEPSNLPAQTKAGNWGAAPPPAEAAGQEPWVYTGSDELMALSGSDNLEEALVVVPKNWTPS